MSEAPSPGAPPPDAAPAPPGARDVPASRRDWAELMASWEAVIGLEVHAQLLSRTKIFCGCSAAYGAGPNRNTCPVCLGHPGVLPVLNRRVVELAMRAALALGAEVERESRFARKNYFYPDLPKGYQISQYDQPLATGGALEVGPLASPRTVRLVRLHLEEDAGKSTHDGAGSQVDFNRSGVPLAEIVSHPDLRSPEEASDYLKELRAVLRTVGACDGNMEEGSLRCDANVSVRRRGETALGTRTELKNLNSFKFVKDAIEHEVRRQIEALEAGERIVQETRLYDVEHGRTVAMRSKEEAHDYRYFPEPDLPPLHVTADWIEAVRGALPELPRSRRRRFVDAMGLSEYDAGVIIAEDGLAEFFEAATKVHKDAKAVANFLMSEFLRELREVGGDLDRCMTSPREVGALLELVAAGTVARATAKEILPRMFHEGVRAEEFVREHGLAQVSDTGEIAREAEAVVQGNAKTVAAYHAALAKNPGAEPKQLGYFMGQLMKRTGGKAKPDVAKQALRAALEKKKP